jgi:hypothetical protein
MKNILAMLFRPTNSIDRMLIIVFLMMFMLYVGQAPVGKEIYVTLIICSLFFIMVFRNINLAAMVLFLLNIYFRLYNQISHWPDQIFVQNYGLSSLLSGFNIYSNDNLAGQSFSYYLPMGSLFGSLPIYFGIEHYWNLYHLIIPVLFMVPFIHNQSIINLSVFIVTAFFFPLVDYTTGGGNVELNYAFLLPGIYLLIHNKNIFCALVFLSFGIMLRQPNIFIIPFVLMVLFKEHSKLYTKFFVIMLFLAGGWYIVKDVDGFLQSNFRDSISFQEIWYIRNGGLKTNFSISTILHFFGFKDAWYLNNNIYLSFIISANILLILYTYIVYSKNRIDAKAVLSLGIVASLFVYVLSKGFTLLHYILSCCFLFLSFYCSPYRNYNEYTSIISSGSCYLSNLITRVIAGVVVLLIVIPFSFSIFIPKYTYHSDSTKYTSFVQYPNESTIREISLSPDRVGTSIPTGGSIILQFDNPLYISEIEVLGEKFQRTFIEGVDVGNYPGGNKTTGFIKKGILMGSNDGLNFYKISDVNNVVNYHVYPVRFKVERNLKYIKIVVNQAYDSSASISIGYISAYIN